MVIDERDIDTGCKRIGWSMPRAAAGAVRVDSDGSGACTMRNVATEARRTVSGVVGFSAVMMATLTASVGSFKPLFGSRMLGNVFHGPRLLARGLCRRAERRIGRARRQLHRHELPGVSWFSTPAM